MDQNYFEEIKAREQTETPAPARAEILQKAIDTWGPTLQEDVCIEEMSELTKAIIKHRRASNTGRENILEEIADVQIMLDQMRLIYGDTTEQEAFKVERLRKRLEDI